VVVFPIKILFASRIGKPLSNLEITSLDPFACNGADWGKTVIINTIIREEIINLAFIFNPQLNDWQIILELDVP
jgi:hypothetical protein